ncbi:MAG TPA: CheR family methyltransferase [Opitutaceae bacterium]|nr:CheR family methyltransferase [Opitutaceae bacterium]
MLNRVPEAQWSRLSEVIAETTGLHFPRERWDDLQRGLAGAAQEFGFEDAAACVGWLLSAPPTKAQLQVLASHLTIGETYFFRDKQTLEALAENILPELIRARRGHEQRLRIWSAACCSGEEPYSLAILLHQSLPDLQDWQVTITATDINARFLHKAAAGIYGEWSFRNAPAGLKERYFNRTADGRYAIVPEIKKLVTFAYLNLVEDVYPSLATDTNAMDLIFCRNVLMYFTPPQVRKVIGNLRRTLVEGGWLVVSPSEASHALFPQFVSVNFPGAIFYQKSDATPRTEQRWTPAPLSDIAGFVAPATEAPLPWAPPALPAQPSPVLLPEDPAPAETSPAPYAVAESFYHQGRYAEAVDTLVASFARHAPDPQAFSLLARALANQGKLADALAWCDRWIAADKLDPAGHYLRAVVLLERGDPEQARSSLQRALYLHPDFVLAHFTSGNLARSRGKAGEADKYFANALRLLRGHEPNDLLPESDGLTAGRLTEFITSMTTMESSP